MKNVQYSKENYALACYGNYSIVSQMVSKDNILLGEVRTSTEENLWVYKLLLESPLQACCHHAKRISFSREEATAKLLKHLNIEDKDDE